MTLEDNLKEDFIETLENHNDYTPEEALKCWEEQKYDYLDSVYQHMSDEIFHSTEMYEKGMR